MKRFTHRPSKRMVRPASWRRWLSGWIMRRIGWSIEGEVPTVPKWIAIGAFHTSNWDFVIMLLVAFRLRLRANWIGKDSLFKGVFGKLMRWLGGIPIRRDASYNAVEQVIQAINEQEHILLVVAPEGTRDYTDHWKTGFYWMAHGAGIPIGQCYINYERKVIGFGPLLYPSGDIEADFEQLREFYTSHARGKFPAQESTVRVRPRSETPNS